MASRMALGTEKDISDKTEEIKINPIIVVDCANINESVLTNVAGLWKTSTLKRLDNGDTTRLQSIQLLHTSKITQIQKFLIIQFW